MRAVPAATRTRGEHDDRCPRAFWKRRRARRANRRAPRRALQLIGLGPVARRRRDNGGPRRSRGRPPRRERQGVRGRGGGINAGVTGDEVPDRLSRQVMSDASRRQAARKQDRTGEGRDVFFPLLSKACRNSSWSAWI